MEIIGSAGVRSKTFGGYNTWVLGFTDDSLIVAKVGGSGLAAALTFQGLGTIIHARSVGKKSEQLKTFSAENLLKENKDNYEIKYSDIKEVRLKKPGFVFLGGAEIDTDDKKYKFEFEIKKKFQEYSDLIRSVLDEKTKLVK